LGSRKITGNRADAKGRAHPGNPLKLAAQSFMPETSWQAPLSMKHGAAAPIVAASRIAWTYAHSAIHAVWLSVLSSERQPKLKTAPEEQKHLHGGHL
jgi:hypothetical protein